MPPMTNVNTIPAAEKNRIMLVSISVPQ